MRRGKDPEVICLSVGLDNSFYEDPLRPFPLGDFFQVLNGLARHLNLPELGVLIADRIRIPDLFRIAPIFDVSETLEEVLLRICEAAKQTLIPGCEMSLSTYGDRCLLRLELPPGSPEIQRPFAELLVLTFQTLGRRALGSTWTSRRLLFRHRSTSSLAALRRSAGQASVHLGQRCDGIEFFATLLDKEVLPRPFDLGTVRHVIHRELMRGDAHIDRTARSFGPVAAEPAAATLDIGYELSRPAPQSTHGAGARISRQPARLGLARRSSPRLRTSR